MLKSFKSLIILLILTILLSACDWGRTPSNIRFAKNCNVEFPSDVQVIKDEYEGMGNDWAVYYTIKLTRPEMISFISKVKRLNIYYSAGLASNENESSNELLIKQYREGAWYRKNHSYEFYKDNGGITLNADVDTVNLTAEFQEFGR